MTPTPLQEQTLRERIARELRKLVMQREQVFPWKDDKQFGQVVSEPDWKVWEQETDRLIIDTLSRYDAERQSAPEGAWWQPIETAPKDCRVLVVDGKNGGTIVCAALVSRYGWQSMPGRYTLEPLAWMPLPQAPPTPGTTNEQAP